MLNTAAEIFEKLRSASRVAVSGGTDDPANSDDPVASDNPDVYDNKLSYMVLMRQMNRLIRNLTDYTDIKDIEANLSELINDLINIDAGIGVEPASTGEQEPDNQWKADWSNRVANLKAQISAMPVYRNEDRSTAENGASGAGSGILTELQRGILEDYDRDNSCRELDDITRRYLSNHNAVYNGLIYLQSPYSSLAIFALILAFSFDLSGFIFGFIAQGDTEDKALVKAKEKQSGPMWSELSGSPAHNAAGEQQVYAPAAEEDQVEWSILKTMNPYIILTGDYELRDSTYYYKTFKDGLPYEWAVQDTAPYTLGIYIQAALKDTGSKGKPLPEEGKRLRFAQQENGPSDGIYMNCRLVFHNGSLLLVQSNQRSFLAGIDEYVPIHSYHPKRGESHTVPAEDLAKQELNARIAVVALNDEGTRIAAIYAIEYDQMDL